MIRKADISVSFVALSMIQRVEIHIIKRCGIQQ